MPAEHHSPADAGSCSVLASRLFGTAARVDGVHRDLSRLGLRTGTGDLAPTMDELDAVVTDLVELAEAVQRLAGDLGEERAGGGARRDRVRSGRSHAALERVARRVRPVR